MSEVDLIGDARSPAGHAAFSMRGTDDRWVLIQVNTFNNWVNEQVRQVQLEVEDLQTDLCDGIKLCGLMEVLLNKRIGKVVKKPINQHQYLENVTLALRAMKADNIKLVNIGSEDIVNGNLKLILGMVWKLILRYQIGKASKVPPKKLMLSWLNAVITECKISNFNTDWNNGIALHALIEYCRPGTCPNWRQLRHGEALKNCKAGMALAKQHFDIPMVVSPENLASTDLDELSGMTYLSYFMKVNSPGYHATMNWVNDKLSGRQVNNFQTDWNDGAALMQLVNNLGGNVPGSLDHNDWAGNITKAMTVAETNLGVVPVISAREMADPEVDHLGVMAYAAWFHHLSPGTHSQGVLQVAAAPAPVAAPPPKPRLPPARMLQIIPHQKETQPNSVVTFALDILDDDVRKSAVRVEVVGPSSKPEVTLNWQGDAGLGQFIPLQPGPHKIIVYNEESVIEGCPVDLLVKSDASQVRLDSPIPATAQVNRIVPIKISVVHIE